MSRAAILGKLKRLRGGAKPSVLDLFAGCGGISLGFESAGFEIGAAVEFDADAARSHGLNFHGGDEACRRRFKFEPPRRSNIEPGVEADFEMVGCG
jgi:site-specific DNA-cytosine methylase